jgi:hypothetical protein
VIWLGALTTAVLAACGDDAAGVPATAAKRSMTLSVRFDDGAGRLSRGTLTCRPGRRRATGIARPAARSCSRMRAAAGLLISQPRKDRVCTMIYGGPQQVRVAGVIDGKRVVRRFTRANGCQVADYDRLAIALPAIRVN